jgi:hypothetical protein
MPMLDQGLHGACAIVAKNPFDLVKEPPFGGILTEEPSCDGKDDEKRGGKRKSRVEAALA